MAGKTRARIVTYGIGTSNDIHASEIRQKWPGGIEFTCHTAGKSRRMKSRLVGRHMVYPLLAAVAVAQDQGMDMDRAMERISRMEPTKGRMLPVHLKNGAVLVRDDFKSTQETIYAALDAFSEIPAKTKIVVLGEVNEPMADNIAELYRDIGRHVGRIASRAIFLGHKKSCRNYLVGAKQGGLEEDSAQRMGHDVLGVIRVLREELGPGDLVLLKGRTDQRLIRIALALEGLEVACDLGVCTVSARNCRVCPMLSKKWPGLPSIKR
jgi:UDP-N-acetylmuramoyl-tripeptide--D-alanyl-D-alanine ligase